jgi:hypothetical protein
MTGFYADADAAIGVTCLTRSLSMVPVARWLNSSVFTTA